MAVETPTAPVTPQRLMEIAEGFWLGRTVAAALELKIFTNIAAGHDTLPSLLAATGTSRRGLPVLMDALVGLGLLTRKGDGEAARYALAPDAAAFLVEGRDSYLGDFLLLNSIEYQVPLVASDKLYAVGFIDSGTVERTIEIKDYRVTAGLGLRIVVPMLGPVPIALDFGVPIVKGPDDRKQLFSFWLGFFN